MARIKIAQITEATGAGVGRHVIDVVTALERDPSLEVHLLHAVQRMDTRYQDGLQNLSAKIQAIPMQREINLAADWRGMIAIWQYLQQQGPFEVVHVHSAKAGAIGAVAARLAGVTNIVFTPHAFYSAGLTGRKRQVYQMVERLCGLLCHHLVAVSADERDYITSQRLVAPAKLSIVPNGIAPPDLAVAAVQRQKLRQAWGISPQTRLIGSIGRMSAQKDPLLFVELAARRARRYQDEHYVMVGDGDLAAKVRSAIDHHQMQDRFLFLGFRADVEAILAALDIYVLHSRYEAMPYIVLEAMGQGLPVVTTRVAGVMDPLQAGGIVAEVGDVQSLDLAVDQLVDVEVRQQLGAANRRRLEQFYAIQPMVASLREIYLPAEMVKRSVIA